MPSNIFSTKSGDWLPDLSEIEFPLTDIPSGLQAERTALRVGRELVHCYVWCYLERRTSRGQTQIDIYSISQVRAKSTFGALLRLSKYAAFRGNRAQRFASVLGRFRQFMDWADKHEHRLKYESVLSDGDLALDAIKAHHTFLRGLVEAGALSLTTAASRDQDVMLALSEIHSRDYRDIVEPLSNRSARTTKAVEDKDVARMIKALQTGFDFAVHAVDTLNARHPRASIFSKADIASWHEGSSIAFRGSGISLLRLLHLACIAFAGIALLDSGANLAQIAQFEVPVDLHAQLSAPDRVSLTQRVIKFRAGGKLVPVTFTALTISRIQAYLAKRDQLVHELKCADPNHMFVRATYTAKGGVSPVGVDDVSGDLLGRLRGLAHSLGVEVPRVTLRELRAYKQQHLVRLHGPVVAAQMLGHTVATAMKAYCAAQESVRKRELGEFFASLKSVVVSRHSGERDLADTLVSVPSGACRSHGSPSRISSSSSLEPDCRQPLGCFDCAHYRVHDDEQDMRKLLSCRKVLLKIVSANGAEESTRHLHASLVDRVNGLLRKLEQRSSPIYIEIEADVEERGNLTPYWSAKLQQLHLLGMLS